MTVWVENPFQGFEVGWTWAQHVAAGYQGGTDYIFYPSDGDIVAAADGRITLVAGTNGFTPGPAILLALSDGRAINYREVAKPLVKSGQTVVRGQAIGVANRASRWPHIDATVNGKRAPFEPLVNIGLDPSGGGGTPVPVPPTQRINGMTTLYYDLSVPKPFLYALAGDSPGTPANWLETTSQDLGNQWLSQHGGPAQVAALTHDSFLAYKAAYQAPLAVSGSSSVDPAAIASQVVAQFPPFPAFPTVPTAAQNGAAARAAIVAPAT